MDTPKAVSPSFSLSLYPRTDLKDCHTSLQKKLSSQWGDPKEGGWRWGNPVTRRHGTQSTLQSSSSPETPPSFGGTRFSAAAGGSHRIWRPGWGADWLAYPPQRPQPQDSPAWGPSLLRPQGRDVSPGPQGPRGTESAALLSFFLSFLLCLF